MKRTDEVILEESRLVFERLKNQWHTMDAKSSSFLQTSAMILTVLVMVINVIMTLEYFSEFLALMLFSIAIISISVILSIGSTKMFKITEIDIEVDFDTFEINDDTKEINKLLISQYGKSIKSLHNAYDSKTNILRYAQICLIIGIIGFAISVIIVSFLSTLPK